MRFCDHERRASSKECSYEMYAGKRTQKYSKDDKDTLCSYPVTYPF